MTKPATLLTLLLATGATLAADPFDKAVCDAIKSPVEQTICRLEMREDALTPPERQQLQDLRTNRRGPVQHQAPREPIYKYRRLKVTDIDYGMERNTTTFTVETLGYDPGDRIRCIVSFRTPKKKPVFFYLHPKRPRETIIETVPNVDRRDIAITSCGV